MCPSHDDVGGFFFEFADRVERNAPRRSEEEGWGFDDDQKEAKARQQRIEQRKKEKEKERVERRSTSLSAGSEGGARRPRTRKNAQGKNWRAKRRRMIVMTTSRTLPPTKN